MEEVIVVSISRDGKVNIEAKGYRGPGCKAATRFLTDALNIESDAEKLEFYEYVDSADIEVENHSY